MQLKTIQEHLERINSQLQRMSGQLANVNQKFEAGINIASLEKLKEVLGQINVLAGESSRVTSIKSLSTEIREIETILRNLKKQIPETLKLDPELAKRNITTISGYISELEKKLISLRNIASNVPIIVRPTLALPAPATIPFALPAPARPTLALPAPAIPLPASTTSSQRLPYPAIPLPEAFPTPRLLLPASVGTQQRVDIANFVKEIQRGYVEVVKVLGENIAAKMKAEAAKALGVAEEEVQFGKISARELKSGIKYTVPATAESAGRVKLSYVAKPELTPEQMLTERNLTYLKEMSGAYDILINTLKVYGATAKDIDDVTYSMYTNEAGAKELEVTVSALGKTFKIYATQVGNIFQENVGKEIDEYFNKASRSGENYTKRLEQQAKKVKEIFSQYGLESGKLTIREQPAAGITYFTVSQKTSTGATREATVAMNKWGESLVFSNRRILDLTQALMRNTYEVFKWSVGATLVYGSYQKLNELYTLAVDNETKLAHINIILGSSQLSLNEIFESAAQIANDTGESVNGVLEAYTAAYRAIGDVSDAYTRTALANKLLNDSLILAKLSSLSTAEAIDVLSGSLRQLQGKNESTTEAFQKSRDLLDSWVILSRKANVDVATLATAFSVTEEAAANAGLSLEQINAIIASISEKAGMMGGKETGNAVRMLVGGLYTDASSKALQQFGIATKTATGEARNFLDIAYDIYTLNKAGLIDSGQLSKLAYVLGGGVRNAQRFQLVLTDLPRIMELVSAQSNRAGVTQEALGKTLDTVQTHTVDLSNAFQRLANNLGTSGGLLDSTKVFLTVATSLVNVLGDLTRILGAGTLPALATMLYLAFGRTDAMSARIASLSKNIDDAFAYRFLSLAKTEEMANKIMTISPYVGRIGVGLGAGILMSLGSIRAGLSGDKYAAGEAAVAVAGSIVGILLANGNPIGSIIGTSAATALYEAVVARRGEYTKFFEEVLTPIKEQLPPTAPSRLTPREIRELEYQKQLEYYSAKIPQYPKLFAEIFQSAGIPVAPGYKIPKNLELDANNLQRLFAEVYLRGGFIPGTARVPIQTFEPLIRDFLKLLNEHAQQQPPTTEDLQSTAIVKFINDYANTNKTFIHDLRSTLEASLREMYVRGRITPTQYAQLTGTAEKTGASMAIYEAIRNLPLPGINKEATQKLIPGADFGKMIVFASEENKEAITEIMSTITDLTSRIQASKDGFVDWGDTVITTGEATDKVNSYLSLLADILKEVNSQTGKQQAKSLLSFIPTQVDLDKITKISDYEKIIKRAKEIQSQEFSQLVKADIFSQQEVDTILQNTDPILVKLGGGISYKIAQGIINSKYIEQALQEAIAQGEVVPVKLDYQFLNVTQAQFESILAQYQKIKTAIENKGGTVTEEPLLTFFKDTTSPIYFQKDWKIIQYLLSQILDTEKKQLDGIYNLPSEATAWVPFQSLQYAYNKGLNESGNVSFNNLQEGANKAGTELSNLTFPIREVSDELLALRKAIENITAPSASTAKRKSEDIFGAGIPITTLPDTYLHQSEINSSLKRILPDTLLGQQLRVSGSITGTGLSFGNIINEISTQLSKIPDAIKSFVAGLFTKPTFNPPDLDIAKRKSEDIYSGLPSGKVTASASPTLTTSLKLNINSNITLNVDGRTLANLVKTYLWEDLIKYVNAVTTATQTYTIV